MIRIRTHAGVCLLSCLMLAGCQAPQATAPEPAGQVEATGFGSLAATRLMPESPLRGAWVVTAGDDEGATRPYTLEPTADGWTLTEEGQSQTFFVREPGGGVALARDVNIDQKAIVWYEQPLTVLPTPVTPDATARSTSPTRVTNLDGDGQKAAGTTSLEVTEIWQAPIETPAGTFDNAVHVRQERFMDLGLAKVSIVIDTAYVPGLGPVAEEVWRTEQLLLGKKQKHTRVELAERPQPQPR